MAKGTAKTNKKLIDRDAFAVRLRALRKESGLTQTALAEKIGSSRSCVANWENGSRFPENKFVDAIARVFGVPIDYMYGTSKHRYNIKIPEYFELDLTKLNEKGQLKIYEYYKLLLNTDEFINKGL